MLTIESVLLPTPGFLIDYAPATLPSLTTSRHLYVARITILRPEPLRTRREFLPILRARDRAFRYPPSPTAIKLPLALLRDGDLLEMPAPANGCRVYQYTAGTHHVDATRPKLRPIKSLPSLFRSILARRRPRRIFLEAPPCAS